MSNEAPDNALNYQELVTDCINAYAVYMIPSFSSEDEEFKKSFKKNIVLKVSEVFRSDGSSFEVTVYLTYGNRDPLPHQGSSREAALKAAIKFFGNQY